jgi:hypothetical protein
MMSLPAPLAVAFRRLRGATALALLLAASARADGLPTQDAQTRDAQARDLPYGVVLFDAYRQQYFSATSALLAAQQLQRLPHHAEESQLLLGELYLAWGLYPQAQRIFEQQTASAAPRVLDRAWFYLGKLQFQNGQYAQAEVSLRQVGATLDRGLQEELVVLRTNLLAREGRFAEAAAALAGLVGEPKNSAVHFARFNLGIARIRSDEQREGVDILRELGKLETRDPELKGLRDQANLTLAYLVMKRSPLVARDFLRQIRLKGPHSNRALLGLGWTEAQRGNYEVALVPLREVSQRPQVDQAVMESMLAIGNILEHMRAHPQAVAAYQQAIAFYEDQQRILAQTRAAVRGDQFLQALLPAPGRPTPRDEAGWFWEADALPDTAELRYLHAFMAGHAFHEALKPLRDLVLLRNQLATRRDDVDAFAQMQTQRERTFAEQLVRLRPEQTLARVIDARTSGDIFARDLQRIAAERDALALATQREQDLLARLQQVEERSWWLAREMEVGEYRERYRLLKGLLSYEIETTFAIRQWEARKALTQLDAQLQETLARKNALEQAREQAPARFAGHQARLAAQRARIVAAQHEVEGLIGEQTRLLQDLAVAELDRLSDLLRQYLDSARFSLALLQDQMLTEREALAPRPEAAP